MGFEEDYQRRTSWDSKKTVNAGLRGIRRRLSTRDLVGFKEDNAGLRGIQRRLSTWDFVGFKEDYQRGTSWDSKKIINTGPWDSKKTITRRGFVGFKEDYQCRILWNTKKIINAGFRGIQRRLLTRFNKIS